ncbi:MAG: sulfite exporter TauE/SafE family protein, partial [Deltaproteobacteria bacterium]|nr:sulfite exporter TauE/SafE family protein [Deltaproteobacteria bacterium]
METYLWICIIVFFAAFTQGLSGFGSVLVALPLLAIFLDIKTVIPLAALYGISIASLLLIQLWRHFEWKKIYPLLIGATVGIPIGVFFLKELNRDMIQWILGIILISYSMYSLFFKSSRSGIREGWAY